MKTLGEVLNLSASFLREKNLVRSRRIAEEILSYVLQLKRLDLYMQFDRPILDEELSLLRPLLKKAAQGEPVEYLIGEVSFYHCSFLVNSSVLIPRPETEILVDRICRTLQEEGCEGKKGLDLCTGSGCIGISIKKAVNALEMTLSDLSEKAIEIARQNGEKNQVEVELLCGDLLAPIQGRRFDYVVCNPPYVSSKEYLELDRSVRDFEPKEALLGGEDGLLFYRRLAAQLPLHLNLGAKVFFEIGANQGEAVQELFSKEGWKKGRIEKDWASHDRFFFLEFE